METPTEEQAETDPMIETVLPETARLMDRGLLEASVLTLRRDVNDLQSKLFRIDALCSLHIDVPRERIRAVLNGGAL